MMAGASRWPARSAWLASALIWRTWREAARYLLVAVVPFAVSLMIVILLPEIAGRHINGAASAALFAMSQGARSHVLAAGILLIITPGLVAIFGAIGTGRTLRGMVGAEVSRGGLEALLSAPYTVGSIAAALLGYVMTVATAFWFIMSGLGALAIAITIQVTGGQLSLTAGYLALALALPLLSIWAGAGLATLVSLLLPRLTQLGAGVNLAGGDLGSTAALLPAISAMLAIALGAISLGPARLLLIAGGCATVIAVAAVTIVARGFRPEAVLDS